MYVCMYVCMYVEKLIRICIRKNEVVVCLLLKDSVSLPFNVQLVPNSRYDKCMYVCMYVCMSCMYHHSASSVRSPVRMSSYVRAMSISDTNR